ncbi:MAG: hypothetical protein R3338_15755 [Thermoanaerobaculia bacterium]|nr:hypothetical protein [Thermoanaerobaculia bacterium]
MREKRALIWTGILVFALLGCGESEEAVTAENVENAITEEVERQTGKKASTDETPCEVLDDELIRAHFEIAEGIEIRRSPSKYSPHPLCTVTWDKPNAEELEQKRTEMMMERMQARMRGEEVEGSMIRSTNEVSLTLYEPTFDSADDARSSFDSSMNRLQEGFSASHEDVEMTFQADLDPVEGVGDKAMWAAKMHQLSVVDGNQIFHVTVNTGAELDQDLEKAKEIARDVAKKL